MDITQYLRELKKNSLERNIPNITENNARFITDRIQKQSPSHILEIGTANGYSTLCFAQILRQIGKGDIITIEHTPDMQKEACEHFHACGLESFITPLLGDALTLIPTLPDTYFDFVFIDAMKKSYLDYYLLIQPKLVSPAMIIVDDVKKFRYKMENFYNYLSEKKIEYTLYEVDDDDATMIILL